MTAGRTFVAAAPVCRTTVAPTGRAGVPGGLNCGGLLDSFNVDSFVSDLATV